MIYRRMLVIGLFALLAGCGFTSSPPTESAAKPATATPAEASEPTAEATEEPTEEATEEPTEEATEEPTEEATEEPTAEATEEPTAEATTEAGTTPTTGSSGSSGDSGKYNKLGDKVELNGSTVSFSDLEKTDSLGRFDTAKPGEIFYTLQIEIENVSSDDPVSYNFFYLSMRDNQGYHYSSEILVDDNAFGSGELKKGEKIKGGIAFLVPEDAEGLVVQYTPLSFTDNKSVRVPLDDKPDAPLEVLKGDKVEGEGFTLTVISVERRDKLFLEAEAGNEFLVMEIAIDNTDLESLSTNSFYLKLTNGKSAEYQSALNSDLRSFNDGELAKGERNRGTIAYEVPKDAKDFLLIFEPIGGEKVELTIKE